MKWKVLFKFHTLFKRKVVYKWLITIIDIYGNLPGVNIYNAAKNLEFFLMFIGLKLKINLAIMNKTCQTSKP